MTVDGGNVVARRTGAIAERVQTMTICDVVAQLVELVDADVVAVLGHAGDTHRVRQWESGREVPQRHDALRLALFAALIILEFQGHSLARSWFLGKNSTLHANPMLLLRDRPVSEIAKPLIDAAQRFALTDAAQSTSA